MIIIIYTFRDQEKDVKQYREDFSTLAGGIVCESEKLTTIGVEVAEACTEETLKVVNTAVEIKDYDLIFVK